MRAFTFVELCIGLVVVSLVLGALAAFSVATARAWQQGATTNASGNGQNIAAIPLIGNLVCTRLDNEIGSANAIGGYYSGSLTDSTGQQTSILLWTDKDGSSKISPNEVDLLEYDATNHMIWKYTSTLTTPKIDYTTFTTSWISAFKAMATQQPFARNVDGMQIDVSNACSASQMPLVEYRLYFNRGGHAQTRYGSISLRSPQQASLQPQN